MRPAYICYDILTYNQVRLHLIHVTKIQPGPLHLIHVTKIQPGPLHLIHVTKIQPGPLHLIHVTKIQLDQRTSVIPYQNTTRPAYICHTLSKQPGPFTGASTQPIRQGNPLTPVISNKNTLYNS